LLVVTGGESHDFPHRCRVKILKVIFISMPRRKRPWMDERPERRTALGAEEAPDLAQHAQEHSWREAAGLSVLLARVIGGKQAGQPRLELPRARGFGVSRMGFRRLCGESARQLIARAVRKFISGASSDRPALQQEFQVGIKGDASQRQDRARAYQIEFRF